MERPVLHVQSEHGRIELKLSHANHVHQVRQLGVPAHQAEICAPDVRAEPIWWALSVDHVRLVQPPELVPQVFLNVLPVGLEQN